ncbi:MAG: threonine--tRNA ligase, partial [Nitrospiraceae bacterium]|nr:threonine--tRNA ligase [Nitrospiraceae bacterium]
MSKIKIKFPNGDINEYDKDITPMGIAKKISNSLVKEVLVAKFNDTIIDLTTPLTEDGSIVFYKFDDDEGKKVFWHTSTHIMAQAIKRLYKDVKFAIGPAIEEGFYYDFDNLSISSEDLEKIEKEMTKIVSENIPIVRTLVSIEEAKEMFEDQPYKLKLIKDLEEYGEKKVSIYTQGDFFDLCRGPHLPSTGYVKAFKLTKIAGAYWRGNSKNKMLTRIYGVSFPKKKMLDEFIFRIEEAKKRDHKKLGRELDLFMVSEEGPGFPFILPHGMKIYNKLLSFWREEHRKANYEEIITPAILNRRLWERSGHWDHYKDNMYFTTIDNEQYAIKPMNCPGGILVYKSRKHSYKEFPMRIAEVGLVHRHEMSGVLNGLFRVRAFHQDDAHIFMLPSQIKQEVVGVVKLVDRFYKIFGFDYSVELSTRPDNSIGSDEIWENATNGLKEALESMGMDYKINEGDGAFYGPKID